MTRDFDINDLEKITLNDETNLMSYIILKGAHMLKLKLRNEKNFVQNKKGLIQEVCRYSKEFDTKPIRELLGQVRDALLANGYYVKVCRIKSSSRVLIGANESFGKIPFEVGLYFDPIYNAPFISGSSLKGAFRQALEDLLGREFVSKGMDRSEAEREAKKIAEILFGSERWSGLIGVTDAYPIEPGVGGYLFEPEVVTPHYSDAETELDIEPNPVIFLTIARSVVFEFYIYFNKELYIKEHERLKERSRRKCPAAGAVKSLSCSAFDRDPMSYALFNGDLARALEQLKDEGIDLSNIVPWVDRAILYALVRGIGAKTNIGYSRFEILEYKII